MHFGAATLVVYRVATEALFADVEKRVIDLWFCSTSNPQISLLQAQAHIGL